MFIIGLLQWWYGEGWARQFYNAKTRLRGLYDYFSIDLLLVSWFAPFRQIDAGAVHGSFAVQWHAFVDKSISRFIGAFMRTILIIAGVIALFCFCIASIVAVLLWAVLPLAPLIGLYLTVIGWLPWVM